MGKFSSRLILVAILSAPAASMAQSSREEEVLAAEDEYITAEVARDEPALRRLIDERFVLNLPNGRTSGKEAFVQSILRARMTGQTLRERTVLVEGNVAIVFGTADLRFPSDRMSSLRYTTTYVRRDGQWRMLALQMQQRAARSSPAL